MTTAPFVRCTSANLYAFLEEQLVPPITASLELAESGQRIRITTLPGPVMEGVCGALQGDDRWVARVLVAGVPDRSWKATATKLIELRNTLSKPLIVFIPPGLRTAAEDSLDIATFRELNLSASISHDLIDILLKRVPPALNQAVSDVVGHIRREKWAKNDDDLINYLLTIDVNGFSPESVGAALFTFGLVPHFTLSSQSNIPYWLSRNHKMQLVLADIRQPLQSRVSRLPVQPNTIQPRLFGFLRDRAAQEPKVWTAEIACDPANESLRFEKWPFLESADDTQLRIKVEPLTLPVQSADDVGGTTPLPVLNLDGREGAKVAFRALPSPAEVPAWKTYRVQLLLVDGEQPTIVWESNGFKKPASRQKVTKTIKVSDLQSLEEGTYFFRVDAYDQDGAILTQPRKLDPTDPRSRSENESEYFLVVREGVEVVAPPPHAIDVASFAASWVEANIRSISSDGDEPVAAIDAVTGVWAEPIGSVVKGETHFKLEGEGFAGFTVVVPAMLRRLELAILDNPDQLGRYHINLAKARSTSDVEIKRSLVDDSPPGIELERFLEVRRRLFGLILRQHRERKGNNGHEALHHSIVETADLLSLAKDIEEYGVSFRQLLAAVLANQGHSKTKSAIFRMLALLDVAELRWKPSPGDPGRALVLAPTHPVRLVWHLQHLAVCAEAVSKWKDKAATVPSWPIFLRQLISGIVPINVPMVMFDQRGRAYVEQSLLTSHWSLYLPDRSEESPQVDTASCKETCRKLLGIRSPEPVTSVIGSIEIASRAFEYLQQHPYVDQLKLNVFNPGDGELITEALRAIEAMRLNIGTESGPPPLRYSIQMFGSRAQIETMGGAFESLLDPDRQVAEDDEFTLTSSNHLLPKLVFARNAVEDFVRNPVSFSAHLTVLIEQFGSQARLGQVSWMRRGSFVGGLVQEPETSLQSKEAGFGWYKGLRAQPGKSASSLEVLLTDLVTATQSLQAASATGEVNPPDIAPQLALFLGSEGQSLLRLIHLYSDWVLTIDRNLGLEYFDSPSTPEDTGYLLDYAPEFLQEDRQRILLTTKSTLELRRMIRPAIERFGLTLPSEKEAVILNTLRSLSGRLVLKFLSAESHSAEVVGLLLAHWLMEQSGLLSEQIVVPLDAHRGWFRPTEDNLSSRRADLLLVTLDLSRRVVNCLVVEVKLRDELTSTGRTALYKDMHEQAEITEARLRELFDPNLYSSDRADFLVKCKEFTTALSFYLRRGARYRRFDSGRLEKALQFVEDLDSGYSLAVSSMGIVFVRQATGMHIDEEEPGFVVHRFGLDCAQRLVLRACGEAVASSTDGGGGSSPKPDARTVESRDLSDRIIASFKSAVSDVEVCITEKERSSTSYETEVASESDAEEADGEEEPLQSPPTSSPGYSADRSRSEAGSSVIGQLDDGSDERQQQLIDGEVSMTHALSEELVDQNESKVLMRPEVCLGAQELTPQYGLLGRAAADKVAIDLTGCNTISLFGVQGFGKSYTLGVIAEMATASVQGINLLPSPLATVIFHYHKSDAYAPEFAAANSPNNKVREVEKLHREYDAAPQGVQDIVLLAPEAKVNERRLEFPGLEIHPIKFGSGELGAESWKFLLGAYGNDSLYVRQLIAIMRRHRDNLTLSRFREEINAADLTPQTRRLAEDRLNLAEPYVDDTATLGGLIRPGRTIIVDLRDPWIEKDEALGLFVVMMRIFASTKHQGKPFNKLVIFDEAHKYISESELIGQVVETIREMRHQATSVVIASQDPLSVPRSVIELSSILVLHRMTSPQWLKHLKSAISALDDVSDSQLAALRAGEALAWAQRCTDKRFTQRPYRIQIRPRVSQHGGGTKTAVPNATVK